VPCEFAVAIEAKPPDPGPRVFADDTEVVFEQEEI